MKERLTREHAGIAAVAYLLILGAHVELPGFVPFALFLFASALATLALAGLAGAARGAAPEGSPVAGHVPTASAAVDRRVRRAPPESRELQAMRAALARLEGELYALEDQRLTELARSDGGIG